MRLERSPDVLRQVRTLFGAGAAAGVSDAELLARFLRRRKESGEALAVAESAFEALVARHGPMVLGVCRRALASPEDVEDAFQATFLVLVRRAASVRVEGSLGRWLYGVARKVAARAPVRAERQKGRGRPLEIEPEAHATAGDRDELLGALDEEIARLRCPVGTVSGRLTRARGLLRERLVRRGIAMTAGTLSSYLDNGQARAAVPRALALTTSRAATKLAPPAGAASGAAASLMNDVARVATAARLGMAAAIVLASGLAGYSAAEVRDHLPGSLSVARETVQMAREIAGTRPAVRPSSPAIDAVARPGHRPAGEIVSEIEATRKAQRDAQYPSEEWKRLSGEVVRLVGELRTTHPDEPRLAMYLLLRWSLLAATDRRSQARDEAAAAAQTATDPAVRISALFYGADCRMKGEIGSLDAAAVAEEFARQATGDMRAACLLSLASESLERGKLARFGLFVASLLAADVCAVNWRFLGLVARLGKLALFAMLAVVLGIQMVEDGGLSAFASNAYVTARDSGRVERFTAFARSVEAEARTCLRDLPRCAEAVLLPTLAAAIAAGAIVVLDRWRSIGADTGRRPRFRRGALTFFLAMAVVCLADSGWLAYRQHALRGRMDRDFPESRGGRIIRDLRPVTTSRPPAVPIRQSGGSRLVARCFRTCLSRSVPCFPWSVPRSGCHASDLGTEALLV
ncbi:RNA polymerase sigma factor [Aquisphaera giovannonii]|uniref:RNA polymerase sigma factor n=2 Tax=Aquisphaera giovannonii TaxID=406548 RepID=A0A5B9W296_9BACT|nr:RNA polymerase sigma factor [Aquisphaera giovannonii]